ncbi:MAG TPA: acyl-CoA thioesterase [Bacteriovoracaceae bacterium]|nr:acyl-CoA thioesterase [Bacteriovoracaceae bacterium]
MLLRTLFVFIFGRRHPAVNFDQTTHTSMTVLPVDLDILLHVNNGVYFSYMDFGRWDMIFRNGVYAVSKKMNWYSVVAAETIRFKRSLKLWDRFTIHTQIRGHDEKYFYLSQKIICRGELMSTALVKIRFLKRTGGTVAPEEVMVQFPGITKKPQAILGADWQNFEQNHLL